MLHVELEPVPLMQWKSISCRTLPTVLNSEAVTVHTYRGIALWVLDVSILIVWRIVFRMRSYKKKLAQNEKEQNRKAMLSSGNKQPMPTPFPPISMVPTAQMLQEIFPSSAQLEENQEKTLKKNLQRKRKK